MSSKQLDVEQSILSCWQITDDIKVIYQQYGDKGLTEDQLLNVLIGLETLYNMKFDKLFEEFEQMLKELNELKRKQ